MRAVTHLRVFKLPPRTRGTGEQARATLGDSAPFPDAVTSAHAVDPMREGEVVASASWRRMRGVSVVLTIAGVLAALLLTLALIPVRAEARAATTPSLHALLRVGWPRVVAVGWHSGEGATLWAAGRAMRVGRATARVQERPRRRSRPLSWNNRAAVPGLWRLARALLRTVRLRAEGSLALTWDDPFLVCQAEGLRLAAEGAARRPSRWLSLAIGPPALRCDVAVSATVWLPRVAFVLVRWMLGPDGRAARAAWRPSQRTQGAPPWSSSNNSSGASPTA